jgi:C4-type Zn-finger protein
MVCPDEFSQDLWVTLYKAPDCVISIPEIDFEIGHSAKRELDAIYNHITKAMFNLSQHASQNFVQGDTKDKILDTVEHLSRFLDIDHPWQLVLRDPSGRSILKPMGDNVSLVYDDLPNAAGQA